MAELKYTPVKHHHASFLGRAKEREGFTEAYESLALEYEVINQLLKARTRAGLTQDAVAAIMGTTKSAVSRLESTGKHVPTLPLLKRYAGAVGCRLQVKLVPQATPNPSLKRSTNGLGRSTTKGKLSVPRPKPLAPA